LSYFERLRRLNLETLELRRLRFDLIYYFKILHNLTPHDPADFFSFHRPPSTLRNSAPLIQIPVNGNKTLYSSFRYRTASCWNNLPEAVKLVECFTSFRRQIMAVDLTPFLHGSCVTDSVCDTFLN
jgi:hypothetical protein